MKRIILLLIAIFIVFGTMVAFAPQLIKDPGYVLISTGDQIFESTIVAIVIRLVILFVVLLLLIKLLKSGLNFSFFAWNKIAFASRRRGLRNLNKGVAAYVLGDYKQAEHLLAKAAEPSSLEHIAYLVAADAAQKQALKPNTEHYLGLLEKTTNTLKDAGLEAVLIKVKLFIEQKSFTDARELIDAHHKFIGHDTRLLALEIKLSLIEHRYEYVISQLTTARKKKAFSDNDIKQWEQAAFTGAFTHKIETEDNNALAQYWQQLPRKVKQSDTVVLTYCKVLAVHNIHEPLAKILLPVIKKGANSSLLKSIRTLPISQAAPLISAAQKHLHSDPHDALWLSMVAHFAVFDQQWSLAEKAFNTLVNLDGVHYDNIDLFAFATVLEHQQQLEKANQVLRKIYSPILN